MAATYPYNFKHIPEPPKKEPKAVLVFYLRTSMSTIRTRQELKALTAHLHETIPTLFEDYHVIILPTQQESKVELLSPKAIKESINMKDLPMMEDFEGDILPDTSEEDKAKKYLGDMLDDL